MQLPHDGIVSQKIKVSFATTQVLSCLFEQQQKIFPLACCSFSLECPSYPPFYHAHLSEGLLFTLQSSLQLSPRLPQALMEEMRDKNAVGHIENQEQKGRSSCSPVITFNVNRLSSLVRDWQNGLEKCSNQMLSTSESQ